MGAVLTRQVTVFLLTVACGAGQAATTYYVDSDGNDASTGRSQGKADAKSGPFATLKPIAALTLKSGDRVLLACGQRFVGPLQMRIATDAGQPVELGRFGDCDKAARPSISGRQVLAAGQPDERGIEPVQPPAQVTQVFFGDSRIEAARFPLRGYLIFGAGTQPSATALPPHPSLAGRALRGARVVARTQEWYIEDRVLSDDRGTFARKLDWPIRAKAGVYLTGKAWMIGAADGWAYDDSTRTLALRNSQRQPVSVSYAEPLVKVEGKGSVKISDVDVDAAGANGIDIDLDGTVVVSNAAITRSYGNGLAIAHAKVVELDALRIERSGSDGIFLAEVGHAAISNNAVSESGTYYGPRPSLAAINAQRTRSARIEGNHVQDSAYIGIRFSGDSQILSNLVERSCRTMSDCAGLYTWRRDIDDVRGPVEVDGNVVADVAGDTSVKFGQNDYYAGIYLDEYTRRVTVTNNVVLAAGQGIYLHNAIQNRVEGNLIVGARSRDVLMGIDPKSFPGERDLRNDVGRNTTLDAELAWMVDGHPPGEAAGWQVTLRPAKAVQVSDAAACKRMALPGSSAAASSVSSAESIVVMDCR